jgi:FMN-dependent NADH-azoreductase
MIIAAMLSADPIFGAGKLMALEYRCQREGESCLKGVFWFIGLIDVTFIRAEGVVVTAETRVQALASAKAEIVQISASEPVTAAAA